MRQISTYLAILVVLLASFLIAIVTLAAPQPSIPLQQPTQGMCNELQLVFLVDQSGSMSQQIKGVPPSDPDNLRFYGPAKAVETLSSLRYQTYQTATMRVAVVHFGDKPRLGMPWTVITPTTQIEHKQLQRDLANFFAPVLSMGDTHPLVAFQTASSLFSQVPAQVGACPTRAIIMLTDGEPYLEYAPNFSLPTYMAELADYVQKYMSPSDNQIYVIGIDKTNTYWDKLKTYWYKVTGDQARVLRAENQAHMASLVISIVENVARSLQPTGAGARMECIAGGTLPVAPFLQQIELRLVKTSPDLHLIVLDEAGRQLDPSRADVSVSLTGYDEPIETLTVSRPRPGNWSVQTKLPTDAKERCQVTKLEFNAVGKLTAPDAKVTPIQFKRIPIGLRIVDASGDALPDYGDPKYGLKVDMNLVGPSRTDQIISLKESPGYDYSGDVIPLEAGANSIYVKATSRAPDNSEYVVLDRSVATLQVQPARFVMLQGPSGVMAQHVEMTLSFAIVAAGQQPVQIDLTPLVSATLTFQSEPPRPISLTVGQDGTYQANIQPQQPGRYVLAYRAAVDTPRGSVILGEDRVVFDVYPTKLVTAKVVSPSGDHFVATDMFLRPAGLPLEIQLVDKDGKELSPGEIGATNPMAVFDVKVVDAKKNDLSGKLKLVNTGKPGLFRAENNTLGPGRYEVSVIPATTLSKDYVWAEKSWSKVIYGDVNSLFFAVLGMALVVLAVGVTSAARYVQASKHPLSGYIEVFQQMPASDGTTFRKQFIKEQLPRRNRATITTAKGIAGLLQAIPFMPVKGAGPIGRIIVTCPTEEDSKAGRARVEVRFRDGKRQSALLDPGQAATPLPFGYYIEKGPRKVSSAGNLVEVPDTFYRPVRG